MIREVVASITSWAQWPIITVDIRLYNRAAAAHLVLAAVAIWLRSVTHAAVPVLMSSILAGIKTGADRAFFFAITKTIWRLMS